LYAKDAFGPESADIPMFWQTEYFDGTRFVRNAQDNCSRVAFSQMSFPGSSTSVDAAAQTLTVTLGGVSSVFDFSDPLGSQTCMTATDLGFCRGFAGVVYRASGTPVSYPVQVNLTNYPHLRFDWDANGTYSDTNLPQFMVNFQTYRGHDRVIFWRERL
jgi:MSHA biogenesis protein MshQ